MKNRICWIISLNFLFVKYFHFGVAGAGYATLIAQAISAIMVMYVLMKTEDDYKVILEDGGFDNFYNKLFPKQK